MQSSGNYSCLASSCNRALVQCTVRVHVVVPSLRSVEDGFHVKSDSCFAISLFCKLNFSLCLAVPTEILR